MRVFLILILFISCQPPEENGFEVNSSPNAQADSLPPSSWASTSVFPISLKLGNDFTAEEQAAINEAANSWSDTNANRIHYFETSTSSFAGRNHFDDFRDNEFGIYKVYNWPEDMPATALAVTQIFGKKVKSSSKGNYIRIDHADILLNYDFFDFSTNDEWGYDLNTVVLHEMGHFLGLYHRETSADESVMYPTISRYRDNRNPHQSDEENLGRKYQVSTGRSFFKETIESEEDIVITLTMHKDGQETQTLRGIK